MAYNYSKGNRKFGDITAEGDAEGNTKIDFEEDYIALETGGSKRLKISGSNGSVTINEAYTLPTNDGSDKQVLSTNGAGVVTWESAAGGGGAAEIDIIKLALAEDTNFTWNGSSGDYHQVPFTRTLVDTFSSNPYSTGTNYFTAPSDGVYEFHVRLTLNNIQSGATQYQGWLMTTSGSGVFSQNGYHAAAITQFDPPTSQSILKLDMFTVVDLSANHSASVFIRQIGGNQNNCHLMHWPMQTSIIIKKLL